MLEREQFYLNILFKNYFLFKLNNSPKAGNTLGFKHTEEFKLNRSGKLNLMFGRSFSNEFLKMQSRCKKGINNPQYEKKKNSRHVS
jgi:hypothetical protein